MTVTKTALKKLSRAASNFIALILSRLIRLSGVELLKTVSKFRKKKNVVVLCSRPSQNVKLGIHVVVVQWRQRYVQRYVQKSVMNVQSCFFCQSKVAVLVDVAVVVA